LPYSDGEERFLMLNSGKPPFNSPIARKAVAHAIDAARARKEVGGGIAVATESLWAPGQLGYREDSGYPDFDLEAAKELVKQYEAETGGPLTISYLGSTSNPALGQQLYREMLEAAGMEVDIKTLAQAELVTYAALGQYEMIEWRFFGSPDPDLEYVWLNSQNIDPELVSLNFAQFADAGIDAALARARSTLDESVRDEAYAEIASILNQNTPYIWIERVTWVIASSPAVHGYSEAANGTIQTIGAKTWVGSLWKS
jgi:peptide/nickel transport system substrate-binding protein